MYTWTNSETQDLWDSLIADPSHYFEPRVRIYSSNQVGGAFVNYSQSEILEMSTSYGLFSGDTPSVGNCIAGELTLKMLKPEQTIPRMAVIIPYVRVTNGSQASEWMPQGRFFIDTRETTNNDDGLDILSIHAYDAMLKAEADYPSTSHAWPFSDIDVVGEIGGVICARSGSYVDPRTTALMDKNYQISLPVGYSMREVLANIASMYGGNWVMNYDGQLLLVPLRSIPNETNYLVTGSGEAITFGGVRILV